MWGAAAVWVLMMVSLVCAEVCESHQVGASDHACCPEQAAPESAPAQKDASEPCCDSPEFLLSKSVVDQEQKVPLRCLGLVFLSLAEPLFLTAERVATLHGSSSGSYLPAPLYLSKQVLLI